MLKKMTGRERMLCALSRGVPDRLPVTVHGWVSYHRNHYMNGISEIDAFSHVGLDLAIGAGRQDGHTSPQWQITKEFISESPEGQVHKYTITTPEGKLWYTEGSNEMTTWTIEYMIKEFDDIYLYKKYLPVPHLDHSSIDAVVKEVGNDGIVRGGLFGYQAGPWQDTCCLAGTERMIMECYDHPDWVHEFLKIITDKRLEYIDKNMSGAKFDLVETGGGHGSSTVISPEIFKEFLIPYDKQLHDALHAKGQKVTYHTCGGMMDILELIVQNNCDASETLSPREVGGDAVHSEIKRRIGDKVCLIGGMNQFQILTDGTPDVIRAEVKRLFSELGVNGGYIMATSDHFFDTPVENLKIYADAAKECVYE